MNMRPADLSRLILLAAIWGGSFLFVRMAVGAIGPLWLTELRVGIAAVAMLAYARVAGFALNPRRNWRPYLMLGVLNTALPWALYAWSGKYIGASYMSILNAAAPWFAAVCGAIWLGERLSWRKVLGLALGMLGVALLVGFGPIAVSAEVLLAVLACIGATACYALAGVYVKKRAGGIAPRALTVGSLIAASIVVMPFLPAPPPAAAFTWQVTLAALGISLVCSAAAYLIYFRLIASIGPTRTFTVTFLIPVFGTLWGALFLGEPVGMSTLAGGAVIVIATALVLEIGKRKGACLKRRDRLHFDQERFLHQAVNHEQGVGRIGAVSKHARKFTQAILHEFRNVLRMHQISGEFHHIAPAGAAGLERGADIREHLRTLGIEVVRADDVAGSVGTDLPGDVQKFRCIDPGDLRILPQRLAQGFRIDDPDFRHFVSQIPAV